VAHYQPTACDVARLDLLQQRGYSQEEVIAAIDLAFDTRPSDAEPIRMFSYCAAVALAAPPGPRQVTPPDPSASPLLRHATALYQAEIGDVTPIIRRELEMLTMDYPSPAQWDTAFREMSRANVRRLSYVESVLKRRASTACPSAVSGAHLPPSGGYRVRSRSSKTRATGQRAGRGGQRPRSARSFTPEPGDELHAAQQRAACPGEPSGAAVQPLDPQAVLGSATA
jgi:hypothetical protein